MPGREQNRSLPRRRARDERDASQLFQKRSRPDVKTDDREERNCITENRGPSGSIQRRNSCMVGGREHEGIFILCAPLRLMQIRDIDGNRLHRAATSVETEIDTVSGRGGGLPDRILFRIVIEGRYAGFSVRPVVASRSVVGRERRRHVHRSLSEEVRSRTNALHRGQKDAGEHGDAQKRRDPSMEGRVSIHDVRDTPPPYNGSAREVL